MGSHRRTAPSSGSERSTALALGLLSAAATALGAVPATAAPQEDTRAEVDRLYREAEKATEAYNAADERAGALRREIADAQDGIARKQQRVNSMREALGSLAGSQYRSGGLDPALSLLLSEDPEDYLRKASVLDRIGVHQTAELRKLRGTLRSLSQDRAEASKRLGALERSRKAAATHKRTVEHKLAEARRLLNSLPAAERAAWDRASRSGRTDLLGPGDAPADADVPPEPLALLGGPAGHDVVGTRSG
ncbi:coiled-coil domain-containing protein, partial [Streptomyces cellulosae]